MKKAIKIEIKPENKKAVAFIEKIIADKKAIRRFLSSGDNYDEIKSRGIKFVNPL